MKLAVIKSIPIIIVGGLMGYFSPWNLNEGGFWVITIPICAAMGTLWGFFMA